MVSHRDPARQDSVTVRWARFPAGNRARQRHHGW
jgi:hypothetical protein